MQYLEGIDCSIVSCSNAWKGRWSKIHGDGKSKSNRATKDTGAKFQIMIMRGGDQRYLAKVKFKGRDKCDAVEVAGPRGPEPTMNQVRKKLIGHFSKKCMSFLLD